MSQESTISITFKLEGDSGGFKKLSVDADGFRKVISATVAEAEQLKSSMINFAALATGIDSVSETVNTLQKTLKGLTDAHAAQIEAEKQLEVNMRNNMSAREEDIQSIKDLCAAQQELGVIGDEVQLSGAQELATYLSEKQSLEKLIPVMNDMLAQQYGLNASQENAAQIATMLGKVMDGQIGALSRYGYTFDDTQEQILKFGTEAQRAAVLCDVVSSSVGGMNAELAKTDDGKQKQLENTIGDLKEQLGGLVQGAMPFVTIATNTMLALTGALKFIAGIRAACVAVKGFKVEQTLTNLVIKATGVYSKNSAIGLEMLRKSSEGAEKSAFRLNIALRGLLMASAVGIVITALTTAIGYFVSSTDDATESTNKFLDAEERAKREAEQLDQLRKQEASTLTNTRAALEINISKLKEFNGTKEQEKKLVNEMNDTYGDTMGYFSSVADWYNALISNSEAYCRQMVIEARTRMLANQIAEKEQETHDIIYDDAGKKRMYSKQRDTKTVITGTTIIGGEAVPTWETKEIPGTSDLEKANAAIKANNAAVANLRQQMKSVAEEAADITFSVRGSEKRPETTTTKGSNTTAVEKEKTRRRELVELINTAKENYITASETEREEIRKNINGWNEEIRIIDALQQEAERPLNLTSFGDIDREIAYQESMRQQATQENIAVYDAEIARLKQLKAERERIAYTLIPIENINTYAELDDEVAYYTQLLKYGTEQERIFAQQHLNDLADVKKAWGETLAELKKPGDISTLDTIEKLSDAISYIDNKIKTASADEIAALQQTKIAYEDKLRVFQRGIEIPSMQREVAEINKLTGREYKVKISGMGFDELTAKINELNRLLNDLDHPVTTTQRKDIESLIATYEKWRKEGINAFETFRNGYGSLKGIGDGVESITDILNGNANAWQTVTGIVDGFLQIYDGIKTIVGIINMLSVATTAHTTAKTAESVAMGIATGAQTAEAVAAETNAAAQIPVIAANKLATASYMELAAAAYFAAHASIPFAGFGIASGFVTAATAMVQAIGVMPFANGGIVSGPTVGLIGEYAGASNNPEVVAPLDKLRGMLNPAGEPVIIGGTLRAAGREIICVLANETRIASKSGKRTNIKL